MVKQYGKCRYKRENTVCVAGGLYQAMMFDGVCSMYACSYFISVRQYTSAGTSGNGSSRDGCMISVLSVLMISV